MKSYTLWGAYASDVRNDRPVPWLKLSGGTLRQCRSALRFRQGERGWAGLVIETSGRHPSDPDNAEPSGSNK